MPKVTQKWPFSSKNTTVISILSLLLGVFFFYIWHLGTLTPGLSPDEAAARQDSSSFSRISDNPVYAPHKLVQLGFQSLGNSGAFWMRLASVLFALLFLVYFYILLRLWFGKFISLLGTLLLAGTPLIITMSRNATPSIMLLFPVALLAIYVWFTRTDRKTLAWTMLAFMTGVSFYIPGAAIFTLMALLIFRAKLAHSFNQVRLMDKIAAIGLLLILIAPLAVVGAKDVSVFKAVLLIPSNFDGILETCKSIVWAGLSLVWRTRESSPLIIERLSLLTGVQIILSLFGIYAMWSRARRELYLLIGMLSLGILAAGLNDNIIFLAIALPPVAILSAAGLRYLYKEWRGVFPLNPLPRALAILLMVSIVALHLLIGARYSLVAWPHTVATRTVYVIK